MITGSATTPAPVPVMEIDPHGAYQAGVCNIGPEEIARRRRAGHVGLLVAVGLFAVLVVVGAPPVARAIVGLPAMISASGYLQARYKFCAGFAARGISNFGAIGEMNAVVDDTARAKDRAKARQITMLSLAVGVVSAVAAVAVPL